VTGLHLVVGHPPSATTGDVRSKSHAVQRRYNAASVLAAGACGTYCKRELPNYQVFDEQPLLRLRRATPAWPLVFEVQGAAVRRVRSARTPGLTSRPRPRRDAGAAGACCVLNASPFHLDKTGEREARMAERARNAGLPLLYAPPGGRAGRGRLRRRILRARTRTADCRRAPPTFARTRCCWSASTGRAGGRRRHAGPAGALGGAGLAARS
jgi:hypothetical protein